MRDAFLVHDAVSPIRRGPLIFIKDQGVGAREPKSVRMGLAALAGGVLAIKQMRLSSVGVRKYY